MDKYYIDLARFCLNEATRELQSAQEYVISAGDDGKFFNKIQGEINWVRQTIDSLGEIALQGTRHITRDAPVTRAIELLRRVWNADCDGTDLPSDLIKEISAVLKTPVRG